MAAISSDVRPSSPPPPYSIPSLPLKVTLGVYTFHYRTGQSAYMEADYTYMDEVSHSTSVVLDFDRKMNPDKEAPSLFILSRRISLLKADYTRSEEDCYTAHTHSIELMSDFPGDISEESSQKILDREKVITDVLINVTVDPLKPSGSFSAIDSVLVANIATLCRRRFPNINPYRSNMNIHAGGQTFAAATAMLTRNYPLDRLDFRLKL